MNPPPSSAGAKQQNPQDSSDRAAVTVMPVLTEQRPMIDHHRRSRLVQFQFSVGTIDAMDVCCVSWGNALAETRHFADLRTSVSAVLLVYAYGRAEC